jgi:hypothetical protein
MGFPAQDLLPELSGRGPLRLGAWAPLLTTRWRRWQQLRRPVCLAQASGWPLRLDQLLKQRGLRAAPGRQLLIEGCQAQCQPLMTQGWNKRDSASNRPAYIRTRAGEARSRPPERPAPGFRDLVLSWRSGDEMGAAARLAEGILLLTSGKDLVFTAGSGLRAPRLGFGTPRSGDQAALQLPIAALAMMNCF